MFSNRCHMFLYLKIILNIVMCLQMLIINSKYRVFGILIFPPAFSSYPHDSHPINSDMINSNPSQIPPDRYPPKSNPIQ